MPRLQRSTPLPAPERSREAPATAIRAAATSYTQLLSSQSDNNIKLIVLERLQERVSLGLFAHPYVGSPHAIQLVVSRLQDLKRQHPKVLQEMIMDIIRVLSSPNLDIRKKTLDIMLDLVVPKNIDEVMQVLRIDDGR